MRQKYWRFERTRERVQQPEKKTLVVGTLFDHKKKKKKKKKKEKKK